MTKITMTKALKALKEEVEGNEDFVYTRPYKQCVYVDNNQPSCLIAKALHRLNVPLEVLAQLDTLALGRSAGISQGRAVQLLEKEGFPLTDKAKNVLSVVQTKQDRMYSWDVALTAGIEKYRELKGTSDE